MSIKQALVFDTNFIKEQKDLKEVINKFKNKGFEVYTTEIAISEWIAQGCNRKKEKYEKLEAFKKDMAGVVSITVNKSYEDTKKDYQEESQKKYKALFDDYIIPLSTDTDIFLKVLERAYMKTPPFMKGESDQGFKDTLMWLSILDYFKSNGEDEVVFVSSDSGFHKGKEILCDEFAKQTNKKIEFKENACFKNVIEVVEESPKRAKEKETSTLEKEILRRQIKEIFEKLCEVEEENFYGEAYCEETFKTLVPFDSEYIEKMFEQMEAVYKQHMLEEKLPASSILDLDGRIRDGRSNIFTSSIEQAIGLHTNIRERYPNYLPQFYSAVAAILNKNFEECVYDDDLPF